MKALVIDDLRDNLMIFDRMLCSQGFADNTLIETPRVLLDWLKLDPKKLEAFDVILMDIALPEMNGLDLSKLLKGNPQFKDIPIVVISAQIDERSKEIASRIGCEFYLKKPVSVHDMRFVKTIAESYAKLKEKKFQLAQEISELTVLKDKFKGYFRKAASSQDVGGLHFENSPSDFIARDWRYGITDKETISGVMFDFEWRSTKVAEPEDFEFFVKLLLKKAVLIVSAEFKKTPIRFLHDGGAEFYIHLPKVSEAEVQKLVVNLKNGLDELLATRPEFKENLALCAAHYSVIPEKSAKPEAFIAALRTGLLYAKAQNIAIMNVATSPFKQAS